ncbi:MAG: DUF4160 domain-containing protein [Bdellovibrionota bacterium]
MLRFGRFKFVIYPQDHRPAHVHVLAAGAEAKFDIQTGKCLAVHGFSKPTLTQLSEVVVKNRDLLIETWEEYEGES